MSRRAITRQQQQSARQPFLAGVEELVDQVLLDPDVSFCERLIGSLRRECLDWFIPLNEKHVRTLVRDWAAHYNHARPHTILKPGIPDPRPGLPVERQI
jgi:hypothetical protein